MPTVHASTDFVKFSDGPKILSVFSAMGVVLVGLNQVATAVQNSMLPSKSDLKELVCKLETDAGDVEKKLEGKLKKLENGVKDLEKKLEGKLEKIENGVKDLEKKLESNVKDLDKKLENRFEKQGDKLDAMLLLLAQQGVHRLNKVVEGVDKAGT